jgi:hypothetical protein
MFFAEPHTASRACAKLLRKIEGSELCGHHHMTLDYGIARDLLPRAGYIMFSVIRDPRDIIATKIAHELYNQKTVHAVAKTQRTQAEVIERWVNVALEKDHFFLHHYTDYKIKYPRLHKDLYNLLNWLGVVKIPELLQLGVTAEKKRWFEYFDARQMDLLLNGIPEIKQYGFDQWETR